jgi:hypothetical protein
MFAALTCRRITLQLHHCKLEDLPCSLLPPDHGESNPKTICIHHVSFRRNLGDCLFLLYRLHLRCPDLGNGVLAEIYISGMLKSVYDVGNGIQPRNHQLAYGIWLCGSTNYCSLEGSDAVPAENARVRHYDDWISVSFLA